jgi:4-hydroxy-4-methyl-2-oxoglutarate aldolase
LAGPAYPVRCTPGDNLAIHVAVTQAPPGSVLVVDVGKVPDRGYWGEVLTTGALARGLAGLVIDGGVRDVAALERLGFPAFSATIALPGATKRSRGAVGVVVVPGDSLAETVAAGQRRVEAETGYFAALRDGSTTVGLLGLDASIIEVGTAD